MIAEKFLHQFKKKVRVAHLAEGPVSRTMRFAIPVAKPNVAPDTESGVPKANSAKIKCGMEALRQSLKWRKGKTTAAPKRTRVKSEKPDSLPFAWKSAGSEIFPEYGSLLNGCLVMDSEGKQRKSRDYNTHAKREAIP